MDIVLVGLNHRTAPIEVRERLAVSEPEPRESLPLMRRTAGPDADRRALDMVRELFDLQ